MGDLCRGGRRRGWPFRGGGRRGRERGEGKEGKERGGESTLFPLASFWSQAGPGILLSPSLTGGLWPALTRHLSLSVYLGGKSLQPFSPLLMT